MFVRPPYKRRAQGFTLIEVAVAVAILGWVLSSALMMVSHYADERRRLQMRSAGQQIAWNQQLEAYRFSRGWRALSEQGVMRDEGEERHDGQRWHWQLEREAAAGNGLWQHLVSVRLPEDDEVAAVMTAFWLSAGTP